MMKLSLVQLVFTFCQLVLAIDAICQTPATTSRPVPKMDLPVPVEATRAIDSLKQRTNRETIPALEDDYLSYSAPNIDVGETLVTRIEDRDADGRIRYTTITTTRLPRPDAATGSSVARSVRTSDISEGKVSLSPVSVPSVHPAPAPSAGASRGSRQKPVLKNFTPPPLPPPSRAGLISELPSEPIVPVAPAMVQVILPYFFSAPPVPPPLVSTVAPVHHPSFVKRVFGWMTKTNR